MAPKRFITAISLHVQNPNKIITRSLSLWSMTKDPSLEKALTRNRRWVVNNQIKNHLLLSPNQISTVNSLQKKFKSFDLQGKALNWLHKYPCCFTTFKNPNSSNNPNEISFTFSKKMLNLVEEEAHVKTLCEPLMAKRLAKLLMLSRNKKLNVVKLNELRKSFGLCEDYLLRVVAKRDDLFKVVNATSGRNSMEVELVRWDDEFAVSYIEMKAGENLPRFECLLPSTWIKTKEKFEEFNGRSLYVSPYSNVSVGDVEKRMVGMIHELLSLTLWKKASILKLEKFRREFGLPEKLNCLLLRHPCIFYVSNRYMIYTVVLREGYDGSELVEKDPMVVVKDKFGELMQEGLHEYNRRRCEVNLEKKRKRGEVNVKVKREEEEEEEDEGIVEKKREERMRFYKVLFNENP